MSESGSKKCPTVSFDVSRVKVGLRGPHWTGNPTLTRKVVATITPKSQAAMVTFSLNNANRASASKDGEVIDGNSVKVTYTITGLAPSPDNTPMGDCKFQAKCSNRVLASCNVLVVIPKTRTNSVGTKTISNTSTINIIQNGTDLRTDVAALVTITIKDQNGELLDSIYDGTDIVEERFTNAVLTGGCPNPAPNWIAINIPDRVLTSGVKLDQTGLFRTAFTGKFLIGPEATQWSQGTLNIPGVGDNCLQAKPMGMNADMELRVMGWDVNTVNRDQQATGGPYTPVPYTINQ